MRRFALRKKRWLVPAKVLWSPVAPLAQNVLVLVNLGLRQPKRFRRLAIEAPEEV